MDKKYITIENLLGECYESVIGAQQQQQQQQPSQQQQEPPIDFKILTFLSDTDFDYLATAKHVAEDAMDWINLPINAVYRVESLVRVQSKWGSRIVLNLRNREGEEIKVWTPSNVVTDLKSGMKLYGKDVHAYLKSLGQKETCTTGGSKRKYFDFETVYLYDG